MPKYIIEREIPGAAKLSEAQLTDIAQRSCAVLRELSADIQWLHSYVTEDKFYCVYVAPSEELIVTHARRGGFPADVIARVYRMVEPITAEASVLSPAQVTA